MEVIDRYVDAVISKLLEDQRKTAEEEIRALIKEKMQSYPMEESETARAQRVLAEMGDPSIMAERYRNSKVYLIGPKNYPKYIFVLKIVLAAVFAGVTIARILDAAFEPWGNTGWVVPSYFASLFSALLQGFAWVTLGFAIAEHKGVDLDIYIKPNNQWSFREITRIAPKTKARIHPADPIVSMVFSALFTALLYFAPHVFAAYIPIKDGGFVKIPLFNMDALGGFGMLIGAMFIVSISKEALKLLYGKWSIKLSLIYCILTIVSLLIFVSIFFNPKLWNPDLISEAAKHLKVEMDTALNWTKIARGALAVITVIYAIDMISVIYKGIKSEISA